MPILDLRVHSFCSGSCALMYAKQLPLSKNNWVKPLRGGRVLSQSATKFKRAERTVSACFAAERRQQKHHCMRPTPMLAADMISVMLEKTATNRVCPNSGSTGKSPFASWKPGMMVAMAMWRRRWCGRRRRSRCRGRLGSCSWRRRWSRRRG